MIRAAGPGDWPAIDRMGATFAGSLGLRYEPSRARETVMALLGHRLGAVFVACDPGVCGMLVAHASAAPWSGDLIADEIALWVDPGARGNGHAAGLLEAYEGWAAGIGAVAAGMAALDDETGALFAARGYLPADRKFMRVF